MSWICLMSSWRKECNRIYSMFILPSGSIWYTKHGNRNVEMKLLNRRTIQKMVDFSAACADAVHLYLFCFWSQVLKVELVVGLMQNQAKVWDSEGKRFAKSCDQKNIFRSSAKQHSWDQSSLTHSAFDLCLACTPHIQP